MTTKAKSETPPPEAPPPAAPPPPAPIPTPPLPYEAPPDAAKPTSGADLVSKDKDEFPDDGAAPGAPAAGTLPPPQPAAQPGERRAGFGRPAKPLDDSPESRDRLRKRNAYRKKQGLPEVGPDGNEIPKDGVPGTARPFFPPNEAPPPPIDYEKMAMLLVDVTTGTMVNVFGPEWAPRTIRHEASGAELNERSNLVTAVATYLRVKEVPDLPPGLMLCVVLVAYAAPRFAVPNTKSKIKWLWEKATGWMKKKKKPPEGKPQPSKGVEAPPADAVDVATEELEAMR